MMGLHIVEFILSIFAWVVQIGVVLLIAALLTAVVVWGAEELIRKKRGRFLPRLLIVFLLLCVILAALAVEPPVICPEQYKGDLKPERREVVQSVSSGLYSWNIPLVPVCIRITGVNNFVVDGAMEYQVSYDVYYFCFGRMGMEYSTYDGFNITDPIFRG